MHKGRQGTIQTGWCHSLPNSVRRNLECRLIAFPFDTLDGPGCPVLYCEWRVLRVAGFAPNSRESGYNETSHSTPSEV